MEEKRSFELIDIELAEAISKLIDIGQIIAVVLDDVTHDWPVLSKSAYFVTLQGPTNRITVPVEMTKAYRDAITHRKEIEMRTPTIPGQPPARRGRKPKEQPTGPQAPVQHPATAGYPNPQPYGTTDFNAPPPGGWLPPGSPDPLARDVATAEAAFVPPPFTPPAFAPSISIEPAQPQTQQMPTQHAAPVQNAPQPMPVQAGENDPNWLANAVDEILEAQREPLLAVMHAVRQAALDATGASKNETKTCGDCEHADLDTGMCIKFNAVPPMAVIVDAKVMCKDFDEAVPF